MKKCTICGSNDDFLPYFDIAEKVTACGMCAILMYMWYQETTCKSDKPKCRMCGYELSEETNYKFIKIAGGCYCEPCLAICITYTEENMLGIKRDINKTTH